MDWNILAFLAVTIFAVAVELIDVARHDGTISGRIQTLSASVPFIRVGIIVILAWAMFHFTGTSCL